MLVLFLHWHQKSCDTLKQLLDLKNAKEPSAVLLTQSTGTSTGTKSHIIPLNNHLNMMNAMMSLMVTSASCDSKHIIAKYVSKLICPLNAIHVPISSLHMRQLCQYICLIWTHCNPQCEQEHWYICISNYLHMPLNKYAYHIAHTCSTELKLWSTYRPHITAYISKRINNNKLQLLFTMLMPYVCQQQICPQLPCIQITSYADRRKLCLYIWLI